MKNNYLEYVKMIRDTLNGQNINISDESFTLLYKECYNKYMKYSQFNFYANLDREIITNAIKLKIKKALRTSQNEWITAEKIIKDSKLDLPLQFIESLLLTRVDKTDNTKVIRMQDILEKEDSKKIKSNYLFNINNLKMIFK